MPINERNYNMQMKKAILRNSEIVIFDKKKFAAAQVRFFFQPAGSETVFVFTSAQWNFVGKLYALKTKKRTLLTSGLLAYMIQKKSSNLYIGRACKRFFNDEGDLPSYLEMDCLEQKIGVSDSILK